VDDPVLRLSFGNVAETYHRVRPPYSQELLDRAQAALGLDAGSHVLDLAAGTGLLTAELARRYAHVVAVEPDDSMRALIRDGDVRAGSAESIPVDDGCVDAVFVGEAFHWFDPAAAIAEIARVLRPRGGLAIVWVHWWETEPPLPDAALDLLREPWERFAAQRNPPWDGRFAGTPFEPLRYDRFEDAIVVDPDALLELYSTTSSLAALPHDEREELFARVRPLLEGRVRLPIKYELTWTRLARMRGDAMWTTEHAIETTASPEAIWRVWVDVPRWGEWNPDIERIELDGPFAAGSTITMTPRGQEPIELRIAEAVEPARFVDEADLGDVVVRTLHRAQRLEGDRVRVIYRMEISGPAADTMGPELGPAISADFPDVLAALVDRAQHA
jgi:SAM-dependent methyltransferase